MKRLNHLYSTVLKSIFLATAGIFLASVIYITFKGHVAQEPSHTSAAEVPDKEQFVPNQVLIQLKQGSQAKFIPSVAGSGSTIPYKNIQQSTLPKSVSALNNRYKIKEITRVIPSSKSLSDRINEYKNLPAYQAQPQLSESLAAQNDLSLIYNISFENETPVKQAVHELQSDPDVLYAEPNYKIKADVTPNDPYFSSQWALTKINSENAWKQSTGSAQIITAVIDSGVDSQQEDLRANRWVNTGEIPGNAVDDDKNGYIDDYAGWNFVGNDNNPTDDFGHGTHVSGIIGAVGNNATGISGVAWNARLMPLKFIGKDGTGTVDNAVRAIRYAIDKHANIANHSWGCDCQSNILDTAIKEATAWGMVTVVAAGNQNSNSLNVSPASIPESIVVAATDTTDAKASFSNWGANIDLAAPGVDILSTRASLDTLCMSTIFNQYYCKLSGTSMAAPHVTGVAALLLSKNPTLSNLEVRQLLRSGAADIGTPGQDSHFGYGRIDSEKSLLSLSTPVLSPYISLPRPNSKVNYSSINLTGTVSGSTFSRYQIQVSSAGSAWQTIYTSTTPVQNSILAPSSSFANLNDGLYNIRLKAIDTQNREYNYDIYQIEIDNFNLKIDAPSWLISQGVNKIVGTALAQKGITLSSYKLEWGTGDSPSSWSTSGISLTNNGTVGVDNNTLATWDTSTLAPNQKYILRLTAVSTNQNKGILDVQVQVDPNLVSGWPQLIPTSNFNTGTGTVIYPVEADLDNDGQKEIIVTSPAGKVYAYSSAGSLRAGFPFSADSGYYFNTPANISDIDNDGVPEILLSAVNTSNANFVKRKIYIINTSGQLFVGWTSPIIDSTVMSDATPAVADLEGDGTKELLLIEGSPSSPANAKLHVYHKNGSEAAGFPKALSYPSDANYVGSVSVMDMDNDGKSEIALGLGTKLYLFDSAGNIISGWPKDLQTSQSGHIDIPSQAVFGDIDGNGIYEVYAVACNNTSGLLYSINKNGTILSNWPIDLGKVNCYSNFNSPSVSDIDTDKKDEIIVSTVTGIKAFGVNGLKYQKSTASSYQVALGDVDADNKPDIASSLSNVGLTIQSFANSFIWIRNLPAAPVTISNTTITQLNNSGFMYVLAAKEPQLVSDTTGYVYLWRIPKNTSQSAKYEWPLLSQNSARTGRLPVQIPSPTPTSTPAVQQNLLKNPGFEMDANSDSRPDEWSSNSHATRSNVLFYAGNYSILHSSTSSTSYITYQQVDNLVAGKQYLFTGKVNIPTGNTNIKIKLSLRWFNDGGTMLKQDDVKTYTSKTSGWDSASKTVTAPANTSYLHTRMEINNLASKAYMDEFSLK